MQITRWFWFYSYTHKYYFHYSWLFFGVQIVIFIDPEQNTHFITHIRIVLFVMFLTLRDRYATIIVLRAEYKSLENNLFVCRQLVFTVNIFRHFKCDFHCINRFTMAFCDFIWYFYITTAKRLCFWQFYEKKNSFLILF